MSHVANACSGSRAAAAPSAMRSVDAAVGFDRLSTVVFRGTTQKFFADGASDSRIDRARTKRPADKTYRPDPRAAARRQSFQSCRW